MNSSHQVTVSATTTEANDLHFQASVCELFQIFRPSMMKQEHLYTGHKAIPPHMLLSKGDVDLSVEFFLKKAYSEAEAVDKTANNIVTAYRSLTDIVYLV